MMLFEFDQGQLLPTQLGGRSPGVIDPDVMGAVREQVLQLIGRPLFPVRWTGGDGSRVVGESHQLIAMDASGQVVSVEVMDELDAEGLVDALARSGRAAELGWLDLADHYPRGVAVFRRDWNAFRESMPPRPIPGPRLYVVTGRIAEEVRPALEVLADSGVEVFEVSQRRLLNGRRFVEVTEPFRVTIPTLNAWAALAAGRRPDLVLDHDEDIRRLLSVAPDGQNIDADIVETPGAVRPFVIDEPAARTDDDVGGYADHEVGWPTDGYQADGYQAYTAGEVDPLLRDLGAAYGQDLPLVWHQLRRGLLLDAVLRSDGTIALPDGELFTDPSLAATVASGRSGVDGWSVWRVTEGGPTLAEACAEVARSRRGRRH